MIFVEPLHYWTRYDKQGCVKILMWLCGKLGTGGGNIFVTNQWLNHIPKKKESSIHVWLCGWKRSKQLSIL